MHKRIVKRKSKKGNKVMYSLRFFLKIGKDTDKQPYKSANFLLKGKNDPLHKNHQHLTDLFDEIERNSRSGAELSEASKETLRELDPFDVECWRNAGWFRSVTNFSLGDAFDDYIDQRKKTKQWKWRTENNHLASKRLIGTVLDLGKSVKVFSVREIVDAFAKLRDDFGHKWSTVEKPMKHMKAVFTHLIKNNDISENPFVHIDIQDFKPKNLKKGTTDDFVPLSSLWEFLNTFYEQELEQKTLMAYWRYMGARKFDPVEDYWDDLTQDENGNWWMMRWCIKSEDKLPELCPVDEEFVPLLLQYRDAMEEEHGSLKRVPMFPWLRRWHKWEVENKRNERRVDGYYTKRMMSRMGCQLWKPVIKSLRSSRSREYRRITNGAYLESIWIGHSQQIAASNYDSVMPGDADFIHSKKGLKVVDVEDENTDAA